MKILVTGSGGREHALVAKLLQNPSVTKVYCAPGNGGTAREEGCENIALTDIRALAEFAAEKDIDLALPGSEDMLVAGIADLFKEKGIPVLGPHRDAAVLEGSKCLAKDFMKKYGIKTAAYENFSNLKDAGRFLESCDFPIVLKADGLAAGKGVLICQNRDEAFEALNALMSDKKFGAAGDSIVIEEFLEGVEASILSFYDGKTILPLLSAKDHKKIGEGESGANTGGMGVISPNPYVDEKVLSLFQEEIMKPTIRGLAEEGLQFAGVIFFGLMINERGVYLLEYNLRMGDPETQAVLALLDSDLLEMIQAALEGSLESCTPKWKEGSSCCVVMASGGYPEAYEKNKLISGIKDCSASVFIAGASLKDNVLYSSGGRVLNVVATAHDLEAARKACYEDVSKISFQDAVFRRDIGGDVIG
ncbi:MULTISPECIES: phosphoribosylamine--glycine ligase [unclassified Oceanispirochaeta]|uniref:phosphoribosylamine--glycine ligase n=1 Tax=unclassified Oceanispirochaeta TaxID=2635722 RepID=UPI000E09D63A|nr:MULTISPECIES: phosphoribosylamine--glycine ligase [unclassified Oceanispirochaeta]MBF9015580.1 phosphoribosylamine--glycine ligase [Oceanispirochaeta sp. M2]NPD73931.1 phosphoribosylamine--glycine ligase [Oceanispirochaeta sp. M1]RDG30243.1 phosphoribosylamine--glycine ligase [Oceanispirochaeta sp. M1]